MSTTQQTLVVETTSVHQNGDTNNSPSLKRRRTDDLVHDSPMGMTAVQHHYIPKGTPRQVTPDPHHPSDRSKDVLFYDDPDDESYEWIRLPKTRDYDLFRVARQKPEDRNKAALALTATRRDDGKNVVMWAKMDTGADANFINHSTLGALLGSSLETVLQPSTLEGKDFECLDNSHLQTKHFVKLDFRAGMSQREFQQVRFEVVLDNAANSDGDGIPNVLLGYDFLREHSMMMMDLEYHHDPDPKLEVIARKAEDENPKQARILVTKYPQAAGVKRPGKPR